MKLKQWQNIFHVSTVVQLAIQITNGITKLVNITVRTIVHAKKIIAWILAHVFGIIASI